MTSAQTSPRTAVTAAAAAAAVAGLWIALALWHPTVTYHLAPAVAVLAGPAALTWGHTPRTRCTGFAALASSTAVTLGAALLLQRQHALDGPTLLHRGSALAEVALVIAAAAALGGSGCAVPQPRSRVCQQPDSQAHRAPPLTFSPNQAGCESTPAQPLRGMT